MELSRRLLSVLIYFALPLSLMLSFVSYQWLDKSFSDYVHQYDEADRSALYLASQQWLDEQQRRSSRIVDALHQDNAQTVNVLVEQARLDGVISFLLTHHNELQLADYNPLFVDSKGIALKSALPSLLSSNPGLLLSSGFALLNSQSVGVVILPLDDPQWRALITVQEFDSKLLDQLSRRYRGVDQISVVTASLEHTQTLPSIGAETLALNITATALSGESFAEQVAKIGLVLSLALLLLAVFCFALMKYLAQQPLRALKQRIQSGGVQTVAEDGSADELSKINGLCQALFAQRHQNEQQFRTLLRVTRDLVILVDAHARIKVVNGHAERLLGLDRNGLYHTLLTAHIEGEAGEELHQILSELVSGERLQAEGRVCFERYETQYQLDYQAASVMSSDGIMLGALLVLSDVTQSEQIQRELAHRSLYDPVSGILNRATFELHLERIAGDSGEHVLCYMDLNRFKLINESCGHEAGDRMLRDVALEMRRCIRASDVLARIGGDEFGLILKNISHVDALELLKQMVARIEELTLFWDSGSYRVGVSIGAALLQRGEAEPKSVFKDAEIACHGNRGKGGDSQISFFDADNQALSEQRDAPHWAMRINDAIQNDDLVLFYQPIAPVHDQEGPNKAEILLRIREGDKLLPPAQFIAAAERFNLMAEVDRTMIRKTFEWLSRHPQIACNHIFSINLSGTTLSSSNLVLFINEMAGQYQIPPHYICFEVTETAALSNEEHALDILNTLRDQGYAFALDDFGSGFASYGYLRQLPVDYVKIDGCFVRNLATNSKDFAIVKSIHDVCQVMGIETVAEFVEDDEILACLREIGVDYAQGYGIGKPQPIENYQPITEEKLIVTS